MATAGRTTLDHLFNTKYSDVKIVNQASREHWLMDVMSKVDDLGGKDGKYTYKLEYGNPQSVYATLALAQAGQETSKGKELELAEKKRYASIKVDGISHLAATKKGTAKAMDGLWGHEVEAQRDEFGDSLAFELFGDGNCIRGRRASESSDVVTLETAYDARFFKEGMIIGASANADGSSPRTGTTAILKVDEDAGTITYDVSDIDSHVDDDYLFRTGDPGTGLEGLAANLPLTVGGSDSFRGINRSDNRRRLAGIAQNDLNSPLEVNVQHAAVKLKTTSKHKSSLVAVCNPVSHFEIVQRLEAKTMYDKVQIGEKAMAQIGWAYITINTAKGPMRLYCDADCPQNRAYILALSSWRWSTMGQAIHIIRDDGLLRLRSTSTDDFETRMRSISNLWCAAPGDNAVIAN